MSESPLPPILTYANLRDVQPADSRIEIERHADGSVTLTEPPDPRKSLGSRVGGAVLVILAGWWAAFVVYDAIRGGWRPEELQWLVMPATMGGLGALLWFEGRRAARRPLVIEARRGELVLRTGDFLSLGRPRAFHDVTPGRVAVPMGSPNLTTMRMHSGVYVRSTLALAVPLVQNRPKDECEWLANELRRAVAG